MQIVKFKKVFLPFLFVSIGSIVFYNLFRWFFDIYLGILLLKQDLLNFWLPIFFAFITIVIWLKPRLRLLREKNNKNGSIFLIILMSSAVAAPIIISQTYLEKASFTLIKVSHVNEIKNYVNEKYFKIESFEVDPQKESYYITLKNDGKLKDILNFNLFIASPFKEESNTWFGIEYHKLIEGFVSEFDEEDEFQTFLRISENDFEHYNFRNQQYFEKLYFSDKKDAFLEAIRKGNPKLDLKNQVILIPKSEEFNERSGNTLVWIFISFGIGIIVILTIVLLSGVDEKELEILKEGKRSPRENVRKMVAFLLFKGPHKATALLLLMNMLIFFIMVLSGISMVSPTINDLLEVGGNRRKEVFNGEYWRLLSSVFIHSGIFHLSSNLIGLAISCSLLEKILGRIPLIISYLFCGIMASLASILWHNNGVSVGASGAIFGLFGIMLIFVIFRIFSPNSREGIWEIIILYAGLSLLFGFVNNADNAAHIGGLISGCLIGLLWILLNKDRLIKNAKGEV